MAAKQQTICLFPCQHTKANPKHRHICEKPSHAVAILMATNLLSLDLAPTLAMGAWPRLGSCLGSTCRCLLLRLEGLHHLGQQTRRVAHTCMHQSSGLHSQLGKNASLYKAAHHVLQQLMLMASRLAPD